MQNRQKSKYYDPTVLKDCHTIIQLIKRKSELVTQLNLQIEFEYKLYKNKAINNGDFPYRFHKALNFLIDHRVIKKKDTYLELDHVRLSNFFNKLTNN